MLYPLKFKPCCAPRTRGGEGIQPEDAESWELVDCPPGFADAGSNWLSSPVVDGPLAGQTLHQIIADFGCAVHGTVPLSPPHGRFPIQIQSVNASAQQPLRVNTSAKAWYIVRAAAGSQMVRNVRKGVEIAQLEQALAAGTVEALCDQATVRAGDCVFLSPGTAHAMGADIVAIEIQPPGDSPGLLALSDALRHGLVRFGASPAAYQRRSHVAGLFTTVTRLVTCEHFILEKVRFVEGVEEAVPYDQPVVWIVLDGHAEIRVDGLKTPIAFGRGDTLLIPAEMKNPIIKTLANCVWLEVTFPKPPHVD